MPNLIGPLGSEPVIWTECVFVETVANLAILGEPDGQELSEQCEAFPGT